LFLDITRGGAEGTLDFLSVHGTVRRVSASDMGASGFFYELCELSDCAFTNSLILAHLKTVAVPTDNVVGLRVESAL